MSLLSDFSTAQLATLAALVFFAGVVDSLAGGGGLITLPAYLSVGLDPRLVLGTNKLASSIGTIASVVNYRRQKKLSFRGLWPALGASVLASMCGAWMATKLDPSWLRLLMLAVIPVVAAFVWTRAGFGVEDRSGEFSSLERGTRSVAVSLPIGWYDGFFGPGTGTFFALSFARVCRYDLVAATGRAKALNLATNLAALAAFLSAGRVALGLGLALGVLSVAGHWVGSHLGLKRGAAAIRPAVLFVCAGLFAKLLYDALR